MTDSPGLTNASKLAVNSLISSNKLLLGIDCLPTARTKSASKSEDSPKARSHEPARTCPIQASWKQSLVSLVSARKTGKRISVPMAFDVGAELELQIVDAESFALSSRQRTCEGSQYNPNPAGALWMIELNTGICRDAMN
jgi:hypothetical protein